jgi:hypothetical protein
LNLFTTLGYNYRKNWQDLDIQRKFIEQSTKLIKSHFDQESRIKEEGQSYNAKLGLIILQIRKQQLARLLQAILTRDYSLIKVMFLFQMLIKSY